MPRVKRGTQHVKRRNSLLAKVKGYKWGRNAKIRLARPAFLKAGVHAYVDRRRKKRDFRRLWTTNINAAARIHGTTYSRLINAFKVAGIELDRKILAALAAKYPTVFAKVLETSKK